jgi:hypothetical protein
VRAKISAEAARLRGRDGSGDPTAANNSDTKDNDGGVDIVQREIEAALERENLDRERGMAGDASSLDGEGGADAGALPHGDVKNSTVLLGDLEEVRQKVDRYRVRASLAELPEIKEAREAVASCYRYVSPCSRPSPHVILARGFFSISSIIYFLLLLQNKLDNNA